MSGIDKTESLHYLRVLGRLGHRVFRLSPPAWDERPASGVVAEPGLAPLTSLESLVRIAGFAPDLFLYVEPNGLIPPDLWRAPWPTVCIISDTHRDLEARCRLARFFDHVFLYHRNYLDRFGEHPAGHVHWLPYACDLEVFRPLGCERDLDVAFVGQHLPGSGRAELLARLGQRWRMNEQRFYRQDEIPAVYSRARIVLNVPLADDLNFRTFEAMSCGALLLTRRIANGQELLFEEGKHFTAYSTEAEAVQTVEHYLTHDDEREQIAAAGLSEVQTRHRLEQRIEEVLDTVARRPERVAPVRRMAASDRDRLYAWYYDCQRMPEAALAIARRARGAGQPWLGLTLSAMRTVLRAVLR